MPILVLIPAPVITSTLCEPAMMSATSCRPLSSPMVTSCNGILEADADVIVLGERGFAESYVVVKNSRTAIACVL